MENKKLKNHLPYEIIVQILSKLPVKCLIRFSCVSRSWRSLLYDPQFAKSHFKEASRKQRLSPKLLISTASELRSVRLELSSSAVGENSLVRNLSFPFKQPDRAVMVLGSCNGLVCVAVDFHEYFYIWNPSTGFLQKLPDLDFGSKDVQRLYNYGFGHVSATADYKVVVAAELNGPNDGSDSDQVEVFSLKANSWKKVQAPILSGVSNQGALSNEALHWLHTFLEPYGYTQVVIAFDLAKEEFREVMLPNFEEDKISFRKVGALLEGFLCAWGDGESDFQYIEIWVMREYDVCESWTMLFRFRVANAGPPRGSMPILFREGGTVVMHDCSPKKMELIWFDKNDDNFDNDAVCSRQYVLEGLDFADDMISDGSTMGSLGSNDPIKAHEFGLESS